MIHRQQSSWMAKETNSPPKKFANGSKGNLVRTTTSRKKARNSLPSPAPEDTPPLARNPDEAMIVLNRSWRTAINNLGAGATASNIRPDIIVVRRLANGHFQLSAYECWSPANGNLGAYRTWLQGTWPSI